MCHSLWALPGTEATTVWYVPLPLTMTSHSPLFFSTTQAGKVVSANEGPEQDPPGGLSPLVPDSQGFFPWV